MDTTNKETPGITGNDNGTDEGVSWEGTGGFGSPVEQRITEQIAGGHAGVHIVWLCVGIASETLYACKQIDES